ncbi:MULTISPECIES: hypothetical protein [Streptococcus]
MRRISVCFVCLWLCIKISDKSIYHWDFYALLGF